MVSYFVVMRKGKQADLFAEQKHKNISYCTIKTIQNLYVNSAKKSLEIFFRSIIVKSD